MAIVEWKDEMSVKVDEIDKQHQVLIKMINDLHDAMKAGKQKEELSNIINEMVEYTDYHFSTEEKYFQKFEYPNIVQHKKEHRNFVKEVVDFKKKFDANQLFLSMKIMNFLKNWLITHIMDSDQKYVDLFVKNGL